MVNNRLAHCVRKILQLGLTIGFVVLSFTGKAEEPNLRSSRVVELGDSMTFAFIVRPYLNEVAFTPGRYEAEAISDYAEPDAVVVKMLILRSRGMVEGFYSYYSDEYRKSEYDRLHLEDDAVRKDIARRWKDRWEGVRVRLTHRVDFNIKVQRHAIIRYEMIANGVSQSRQVALNRRFQNQGFEWRVVDLSDHMIFKYWNFEGDKKVIRRERIYGEHGRCEWATGFPCMEYVRR